MGGFVIDAIIEREFWCILACMFLAVATLGLVIPSQLLQLQNRVIQVERRGWGLL